MVMVAIENRINVLLTAQCAGALKMMKICLRAFHICDYRWRMTKEEAIQWYKEQLEWQKNKGSLEYFLKRYPTLEAWLKYWDKWYRRK